MSDDGGEVRVGLGEFACLHGAGALVTLGLGSCVAVLLHDPGERLGALAHVVLPSPTLSGDRGHPAKFADTAAPFLLDEIVRRGAVRRRTVGRLVGGAAMFAQLVPRGTMHMGQRNVAACRTALRELGVPIVAEAVGGESGRSVWFDVGRGTVTVRSVGREPVVL